MHHRIVNVATDVGGLKFRPPRYYDKIFDVDHPGELEQNKAIRRRLPVAAEVAKDSRTTLDRYDRLEIEEAALEARIKSLERKL